MSINKEALERQGKETELEGLERRVAALEAKFEANEKKAKTFVTSISAIIEDENIDGPLKIAEIVCLLAGLAEG